jgi:hypothetical protein
MSRASSHRILALLAPLALAACGGAAPPPPPAPLDPGVAECRAEARNSAEVRRVERERVPGNTGNAMRVNEERAEVEQRLVTDCLRRRGLTRGGGVEPVRRPALF